MTDAFKCDGCGEFAVSQYQFVKVSMNTDHVSLYDFTLDDIPTEAYGMVADDGADLCDECGLELLEELTDRFGGTER